MVTKGMIRNSLKTVGFSDSLIDDYYIKYTCYLQEDINEYLHQKAKEFRDKLELKEKEWWN